MNPSINYIIASCSYIRKHQEISEHVLAIQLLQLQQIFKAKKALKANNFIKQITIVVPPPRLGKLSYENYYNFDVTEIEGVPIKYVTYVGDNTHASYDQWIQGYQHFPNFDYYFIIEDDYCFHQSAVNFDVDFVDIYDKKFKDNKGYLCQLVLSEPLIHAAISNGFLSNDTWKSLGTNPLDEYYNSKYIDSYCQLNFSLLFHKFKIEIKDTTDHHNVTFYHTDIKTIKHYVDKNQDNNKTNVIITCQEADIENNYSIRYSASKCWKLLKNNEEFIPSLDPIIEKRYSFKEINY